MKIPPPLHAALSALRSAGGRPRLVGGSVRDWLLGLEPKDFDVEVYGLDYEAMGRALSGVRRLTGAKTFWPEEFPEILAEEARQLWEV